MLGDPKRLRTPDGFGFLVSWRDKWRDLDEAKAQALTQRLLDEPGNLAALQQGLGRPSATREEIGEWLAGALVAKSVVAVRTRRKPPTLDAPIETDLRDLVRPTPGEDEIRPQSTTWLELRVVDEVGEPVPGVPIRIRAGDEVVVETNADGVARLEEATTSFGSAQIGSASGLHDVLRERWSQDRDAPWLDVEGTPHLTVSGPAEPLPAVGLQGKTPHTLVLQPRVGRVRIVGSVFDTNKAFVLPDALGLLRDVTALYDEHRGASMLVIGHTDTSGEPELNLALSLDRARAVSAYLTDDVDAWLAFYEGAVSASQRWGEPEDALLLERALWGQGQIVTGDPVRAYQEARGLTVDGDLGRDTRRALIEDYMSLDGSTLPGSITPVLHGCGEGFPLADDGETLDVNPPDGVDDPTDRRVEVLFFDPPLGVLPEAAGETSDPEDGTYRVWSRRAGYTRDMLVVRPLALAVRVTDEETGEPLHKAHVSLQGADLLGAGPGGATDVFGVRTFLSVVAGSYQVQAEREGYALGSVTRTVGPGDAASIVAVALAAIAAKLDVEIALAFADPLGAPVEFPSSWLFTAVLDDGTEHTGTTNDGGLIKFSVPRSAKAFTLTLESVLGEYVLLKDSGPPEVGSLADALGHASAGGRFVRLPPKVTLEHPSWEVEGAATFDGTHFRQLDDPSTKVGAPGSPAKLLLKPVWQFFAFEFHDRYHSVPATVPGGQADGHPMVLEGYAEVSMDEDIQPEVHAHCAWSLSGPGGTVHCLPWITVDPETSFPSPDALVRFESPADTFVVSGDSPGSWTIETLSGKRLEAATTPSAERLRYYDLPADWRSFRYWVRRAGEAAGDKRRFELRATEESSVASPFRVDLDDLVLGEPGLGSGFVDHLARDGAVEHEIAVLDGDLRVYRPQVGPNSEPYFTKSSVLSPVTVPEVDGKLLAVVDHPRDTRAVTLGERIYSVGAARTGAKTLRGAAPIGVRIAMRRSSLRSPDEIPETYFADPFLIEAPDGLRGTSEFGRSQLVLFRCCGRSGDVEKFAVLHRARLHLTFSLKSSKLQPVAPAPSAVDQLRLARDMIIAVNHAWNSEDGDAAAIYDFGSPSVAHGRHVVLVQRGHEELDERTNTKFEVVAKGRAFVSRKSTSLLSFDAVRMKGARSRTAAHEVGHILGLPDEYAENSVHASRGARGISDGDRSPGVPYHFDTNGMMGTLKRSPRGRHFWWVARWIRDTANSFVGQSAAVQLGRDENGVPLRYALPTFTGRIPAVFPVSRTTGPAGHAVGESGLCDIFVYRTGTDGFTGAVLDGATAEKPFGALAVVQLKIALTFVDESDFQTIGSSLLALESLLRGHAATWWNVEAEASVDGEVVRTKLLFFPRFVVRTFPTAKNSQDVIDRTDFLEQQYYSGSEPTPHTETGYQEFVGKIIASEHVHAEINVVESGRSEITDEAALPRRGQLRTRKGKPKRTQAVRLYARLLGLKSAFAPTAKQFEPLLEAAVSQSSHVVQFHKVKVKF